MTDEILPDQPESELPQEVVAALKQKYGPPGAIPGELENQILADAAQHLTGIKPVPAKTLPSRSRAAWVRWSAGIAVAALLVALVPFLNSNTEPQQEFAQRSSSPAPAAPASAPAMKTMRFEVPTPSARIQSGATLAMANDVDANGVVNILDAFALARQLNTGEKSPAVWDQNQDGRIDVADVELIAQSLVTL